MTITAAQARYNYWLDKAALLDPNAYEWHGWATGGTDTGAGKRQFQLVVPTGEAWYVVQGWQMRGAVAPDSRRAYWFHRAGGVQSPLMLPGGTTVSTLCYGAPNWSAGTYNVGDTVYHAANQTYYVCTATTSAEPPGTGWIDDFGGFVYVCRPRLVIGKTTGLSNGTGYTDPEGLYYQRLERLKSLPILDLSVHVPTGNVGAYQDKPFPDSVHNALVVQASCHQGAWVGLFGIDSAAINLYHEISDNSQWRYGVADMYPVRPEIFQTGLRIMNATPDGTGTSYMECYGHCWYYSLPDDW